MSETSLTESHSVHKLGNSDDDNCVRMPILL